MAACAGPAPEDFLLEGLLAMIRMFAAWCVMPGRVHSVGGHSWSALFANYDLRAGRLWILEVASTAVGPYLLGRIRAA